MLQKRLSALCAFIAIAVAACGGANTTGTYPSVPVNSGTSGNYTATGPNGSAISLSVSAAAASGTAKPTLSLAASANAPGNAAALTAVNRKSAPQASREHTLSPAGDSSLVYLTLTSNIASTVSTIGGIAISSTTTPPAGPILLAYWNGSQWVTIGSPATVSGDTISFSSVSLSPAVQIASGGSLDLVVYTGSILVTPTPEPPAPVASPNAVTLYTGVATTINVSTGPGTTITASSSNTNVATVTPSVTTALTGADDTTAAFTVTAGSQISTATITFTDPVGRTTTTLVTTTNLPPAPASSPSATIGVGDTISVDVSAQPNDSITGVSSNSSVVSVGTSPVVTNGTGTAVFSLTAVAGGTATVTWTDTHSQTGTMSITVSAVKNGAFTNGTTSWAACSYAHAPGAPVNPSTPTPATPVPTQNPAYTNTPVPAGGLPPISVGTPPANSNPNVAAVSASAPPVLGSSVALVGSLNSGTTAFPSGESGICQTVAVPSNGASQLSFWVYEGGSGYSYATADQDAVVLDSTGTTVQETLFSEQNCYIVPALGWAPGATSTSGCWPSSLGGDSSGYMDWIGGGFWSPRGPYDLSAYAGTNVTLYFGIWSHYADAATKYDQFMFLGNVQMTASASFPTTAPQIAHRRYGVSLHPRT